MNIGPFEMLWSVKTYNFQSLCQLQDIHCWYCCNHCLIGRIGSTNQVDSQNSSLLVIETLYPTITCHCLEMFLFFVGTYVCNCTHCSCAWALYSLIFSYFWCTQPLFHHHIEIEGDLQWGNPDCQLIKSQRSPWTVTKNGGASHIISQTNHDG